MNIDDENRTYLIFETGGELYAIDFKKCAEIVENCSIQAIPVRNPLYLGAINFHNNIVAVIDLSILIAQKPSESESMKLIVLAPEVGALALKIDKTVKIGAPAEIVESFEKSGECIAKFQEMDAKIIDVEDIVKIAEESLTKLTLNCKTF